MSKNRNFLITLDEKDVYAADAGHLNGQTIAVHMREEIRASGGHYLIGDWEQRLLKNVTVKPIDSRLMPAIDEAIKLVQQYAKPEDGIPQKDFDYGVCVGQRLLANDLHEIFKKAGML